jgi:tetratricopeptide (TPR) repeat protein
MSATLPSAANDSAAEREARVDAAIAEFLQAVEAGRAPSLPEFLARHADLADELREFLADQSAFRRFSESLLSAGTARATAASPDVSGLLPRQFGEFELQRVIGRGGMGTVYAARRWSDGASVAIKTMHPWLALEATSLLRFEREATAATRLRHPHLIPMSAAGVCDGTPYLVMDLIDGESLDRVLAREGASGFAPRDVAWKLADVADALQHAHDQGVIHRDVKPSNLLLARDGRLLIGDFGLARLAQQPSLTRTGEAVGSPAYMSPEQIASRGGVPVDHRTDVYSLGATLYELLAGRPPFVGESREQLLSRIQHEEPASPRRWRPDVPRDLETICLKTLAKPPRERYATAAELAADLRRFASDQPIAARGPSATRRFNHWLRRRVQARPRAAIALAVTALLLVVAGLMGWLHRASLVAQRQQAIDAALVVALTGDLKATDEAIARVEQIGVSDEWLDLLRGRVAFHRGDYAAAIQHLEAAAQASQPTVASLSLQATAQLAAGSWENYEALLDRAASLPPVTAEDFLFRGEAETYFDPQLAVRSLNEAVRRRDTPLARLVRAEARANLAFDTNDLPMAESALADAFIARDFLPDHPAALLESLNAHVVAAELAAEAGRRTQRDAERLAAERDFQALEPFGRLPMVIHNRALFLLSLERDSEAFELLRAGQDQHRDGLVAYDFALALFRRGDSAEALRVLKDRAADDGKVADSITVKLTADEAFLRVLLLRETADASTARAAYDELATRYQTGLTAYFRPCLLLLLGESEAARLESRRLRSAGAPPRLRGAFYSRLLAFNSGELSEAELLDSVRGSRWDRCEALFFAGLNQLARGDRVAARPLLEQCVATRCSGFLSWDWSHAVLRRWETEPQWPAWISSNGIRPPQ